MSLPGLDRRPDREQGRPRRRPHLRAHAQRAGAGAGAGAAPASSPETARRFFRRPAPRLLQGHLGHPRPADHSHHIHGVCYTGITLPDRFGTESSAELLARRNARGQVSIDTDPHRVPTLARPPLADNALAGTASGDVGRRIAAGGAPVPAPAAPASSATGYRPSAPDRGRPCVGRLTDTPLAAAGSPEGALRASSPSRRRPTVPVGPPVSWSSSRTQADRRR
ncbi:acetamidase/formamidase family protein [Streptomyces pseudovenezuelae]|uniref:acetamidase/formamidase family protein n=1 Tax=Streptomyces pseudovenezuelae TaxID=67350 RepID=UPI00371E8126